jgi:DNA-binding NarL/FixJ family response regulator
MTIATTPALPQIAPQSDGKVARLVIADDHRLVRAGLCALIADLPGFTVIGEAADGLQALTEAARLKPEILLLDIAMPGMSGLEALAELHRTQPELRVIILSMSASEEHVAHALRHGARGYLLKDSAPAELELALHAVMSGQTWLSPPVSQPVIDEYVQRVGSDAMPDGLTPRQRRVLKRIAEGASTKEIAFELELSIKTIETYRSQIMERLGIQDIAGLVRYAIRHGIISL